MLFWVKKEEMTQGREATRESKSKPQAQVLEYATAFRKTFRNLLAFKDYENYGYDDFKYATFMLIFKQRSTESNYCCQIFKQHFGMRFFFSPSLSLGGPLKYTRARKQDFLALVKVSL